MAGSVWVDDHNFQVCFVEGKIIISAVPEDDIRFFFSLFKDSSIIHAGINDDAVLDMGFVFFHFLDGALLFDHVLVGGKPLDLLPG